MNEAHAFTKEELNTIDILTLACNGGTKDLVPREEAEFILVNMQELKLTKI